MSSWGLKRSWGFFAMVVVVVLAGCRSEPEPPFGKGHPSMERLDGQWVMRGETLTWPLGDTQLATSDTELSNAEVTVAGVVAGASVTGSPPEISFTVPHSIPAGLQVVTIELDGVPVAETTVNVFGDDVILGEITLVVAAGMTEDDIAEMIGSTEFAFVGDPRPLGAEHGPCSGELITISVHDEDTAAALNRLQEQSGFADTIWHSDPKSGYDSGAGALGWGTGLGDGLQPARSGSFDGNGTVIAVIDTGVSPHRELGLRLLSEFGYDFVDEGSAALDAFGSVGHGTAVAVLAAGAKLGVAPGAEVLPVRVCDENGVCHTPDIALGLCHALSTTERQLSGMSNLVLNLSFGGETPNAMIDAILRYAVENDVLVAASGGNEGQQGSPPHFPAAGNVAGVVAVAALEKGSGDGSDWIPASFSSSGSYLDIAAPGVGLKSGTSSGGYQPKFAGTSFATASAAGALALWREAQPGMSPERIEQALKDAARQLPYPEDQVGAGMLDWSESP